MNKVDHYFIEHPHIFYVVFCAASFIFGAITASHFDFHEAWQYIVIMGYPFGLFVGGKIRQYKEYTNQQLRKEQS